MSVSRSTLAIRSLTLVALAWPSSAEAGDPVVVRLANSNVHVAFRAADFEPDAEMLATLRESVGDKALVCGALTASGSNLSILVERNDQGLTATAYRDSLAVEGAERFDLGELPCLEARVVVEPLVSVEYHAFIAAARYVIDVHVSVLTEGDDVRFGHEQLAELVGSLRFAFLRRASWPEYPPEVLAWMDAIARRMPNWLEQTRADLESEPKNWALSFAMGEALRFQSSPAVHSIELYTRTVEILAREPAPTSGVKLVTVIAEEGLGLSLSEDARPKESIAHFRRGYDLAKEMRHELAAPLAYNLACSYAELLDEPNALTWLAEAIAVAPRYRALARQDEDFAPLRKSEAFRKLVDEPKEPPAQR